MPEDAKRAGRPAGGVTQDGAPEQISRYPKLTVYLPPQSKARLDALCVLESRPAWRILETAFYAYFDQLPESEQAAVEGLAQERERRTKAAAASSGR
jgi:hypothetical protein